MPTQGYRRAWGSPPPQLKAVERVQVLWGSGPHAVQRDLVSPKGPATPTYVSGQIRVSMGVCTDVLLLGWLPRFSIATRPTVVET